MSARHIIAFLSGLIFALGLGIAGMTQPAKVLAFLDVTGAWDPTLAFVMAGALAVYTLVYRLALRRQAPYLGRALELPTRRDVDRRLIAGAVLFGAGWGLSGFCPGPALTSIASGSVAVWGFVLAMTAGMWLQGSMGSRNTPAATAARRTR